MSDSSVFHQLVELWRGEDNTPLEPPFTERELVELFAELGCRPTQDVLDHYTLTGGMPYCSPDNRMFELWGRERLKKDNDTKWDFLWIGDWMIASHLYAIRPFGDQFSEVYIDHNCDRVTAPEWIADSLYEFAEQLIDDPKAVGVML